MTEIDPYYVVVDANIWVEERLMQSSIGSAFLYAVTRAKSLVLLPEVVELEVARVLPEMAEKAVHDIKRRLSLLRQLSGHELSLSAPSVLAIEEGIKERWKQLGGLLVRVPFTHDHARAALQRVLRKMPPCGSNNEQFRDCCIWEAAVSVARERVVHLVSADAAFYENRNRSAGLANDLRSELNTVQNGIFIYPSLNEFLATTTSGAVTIPEATIAEAISKAIIVHAREIAAEGRSTLLATNFELGKAHRLEITGYATPTTSIVAIWFKASFDLERIVSEDDTEMRDDALMTLNGVCSYNPTTNELLEIEVRRREKSMKSRSGWAEISPDKIALERQYGPRKIRFIS